MTVFLIGIQLRGTIIAYIDLKQCEPYQIEIYSSRFENGLENLEVRKGRQTILLFALDQTVVEGLGEAVKAIGGATLILEG